VGVEVATDVLGVDCVTDVDRAGDESVERLGFERLVGVHRDRGGRVRPHCRHVGERRADRAPAGRIPGGSDGEIRSLVEHVRRDHGVAHDGRVVTGVGQVGRQGSKRVALVHSTGSMRRSGL